MVNEDEYLLRSTAQCLNNYHSLSILEAGSQKRGNAIMIAKQELESLRTPSGNKELLKGNINLSVKKESCTVTSSQ